MSRGRPSRGVGVGHAHPSRAARCLLLAGTVALVTGGGCFVSPADYAGRACDDEHPCFDGRLCHPTQRVCVTPGDDAEDAGDGGLPDAGKLPNQPGCVRWTQKDLGFAESPACPTCTVEPPLGNQLTSLIPSATDGQDEAYRRAPSFVMPEASTGRLRGTFRTPASANVGGRSSFLKLFAGGKTVIDLFVAPGFEVGCDTSAGVLQATGVSEVNEESSNRLEPGAEYTFDVLWKRGARRTVRVTRGGNTTQLLNHTVTTPFTTDIGPPTELRLGIQGLDGTGAGWQVTLSDWLLCDDPDASL